MTSRTTTFKEDKQKQDDELEEDEENKGKSAVEKEQESAEKLAKVFSGIHITEEVKQTVRLLLLSEQNNIITSVLSRLNGDKETWQRAQKEPVLLLTLIAQEQQESMNRLQRQIGVESERQKEAAREAKRSKIVEEEEE